MIYANWICWILITAEITENIVCNVAIPKYNILRAEMRYTCAMYWVAFIHSLVLPSFNFSLFGYSALQSIIRNSACIISCNFSPWKTEIASYRNGKKKWVKCLIKIAFLCCVVGQIIAVTYVIELIRCALFGL